MKNKLSKEDIDFFLSYQYIKNDKIILNGLNFISKLKLETNLESNDKDYYISLLEKIFEDEIRKNIIDNKINKIGVLLSGGVDSFLLLYYIRKIFPDLKIFTFTFLTCKPKEKDLKEILKISNKFKTIHKNIYKQILFTDIIDNLKFIYSKTNSLIGDEGLLYNSIFIKEIRKYYDGEYLISGDGIDVLFAGMSMYKLSYLEQLVESGKKIDDNLFIDKYEKEYFYKNIKEYKIDFFYKYGEYFGGDFLGKNYQSIKNSFYTYYNKLDINLNTLKKQIFYNYLFLIENRKTYIYESGNINGFKSLAPFTTESFVESILELNIPDNLLLNEKNTKIIIRELAGKIKKENNINFDFLPSFKIDYYKEFNSGIKYIIYIGKILLDNGYISKGYFDLIPYFVKNSMWYENKIRIYLLLNLYFFISFNI